MHGDVAGGLERRETVGPGEELAGLARPVLAESALHAMDDRAAQAHAHVGVVLAVLRVAEPLVHDAVPTDERLAAVDDQHLAVGAVVQHADVAQLGLVET